MPEKAGIADKVSKLMTVMSNKELQKGGIAQEVARWAFEQTRVCPKMRGYARSVMNRYFEERGIELEGDFSSNEFVALKKQMGPVIRAMCTADGMDERPAAQQNEFAADTLGMLGKVKAMKKETVTSRKEEKTATTTPNKEHFAETLERLMAANSHP